MQSLTEGPEGPGDRILTSSYRGSLRCGIRLFNRDSGTKLSLPTHGPAEMGLRVVRGSTTSDLLLAKPSHGGVDSEGW